MLSSSTLPVLHLSDRLLFDNASVRDLPGASASSTRPRQVTLPQSSDSAECLEEDLALMQALHTLLHAAEADMTIFFPERRRGAI